MFVGRLEYVLSSKHDAYAHTRGTEVTPSPKTDLVRMAQTQPPTLKLIGVPPTFSVPTPYTLLLNL